MDVHAAAGVLIGNCAADRPFVDVQIDLRGCDGAVTEQLLNKFDVGAFLQQEGGEGVTDHMGCYMFFDAGQRGVFFQEEADTLG